ncbi:DUF2207 domain-containing protein [Phytoactinopolyspora mesophila]|uniref:Uncharacterized protein n=1 Tax=Phytoactinopolyspora mesophila TaxID=2650750 RepID=A0A7K3M1H8_9ACTN|nr:DUF2207 domain-containing protein [Phytoactinopolyspora mesophila]NDL57134.1 hypothetical protein [Phytoactinopolyspora mesophila]
MKQPWQVQWHIGADGTVIKQRSKGEEAHEQLYGRYDVNRRLELSDLYALDERLRRHDVSFLWLSRAMLLVSGLVAVALVAGLILAFWPIAAPGVSATLLIVSVPMIVILVVSTGLISSTMVRRRKRIGRDAGFESDYSTIAASEARAIIDAPGTVSGRKVSVEKV